MTPFSLFVGPVINFRTLMYCMVLILYIEHDTTQTIYSIANFHATEFRNSTQNVLVLSMILYLDYPCSSILNITTPLALLNTIRNISSYQTLLTHQIMAFTSNFRCHLFLIILLVSNIPNTISSSSPVDAPQAASNFEGQQTNEVQIVLLTETRSSKDNSDYEDGNGITYGDRATLKLIGDNTKQYQITSIALASVNGPTNVDYGPIEIGEASVALDIPLSTFALSHSKHLAITLTYEWKPTTTTILDENDPDNTAATRDQLNGYKLIEFGKGGLRKKKTTDKINHHQQQRRDDDGEDEESMMALFHQETLTTKVHLNPLQWCLHCSFN